MDKISDVVGLFISVVVVLGLASALFGKSRTAPKLKAKAFMTDAETAFYRRLRDAAEPLNVAPQVAMAAIVTTAGGGEGKRRGARNTFDRKIIDFVLFDDNGNARLIIELDDRTHRVNKDAARDTLTASAGHTTLRIRGIEARDVATIRAKIAAAFESAAVTAQSARRR